MRRQVKMHYLYLKSIEGCGSLVGRAGWPGKRFPCLG
jgi:hypothetical protein